MKHRFGTDQPSNSAGPVVVTVFNQKGGIGKTTTSVNLATCLAAGGWQVALIDVDSQSNATSSLGMVATPAPGAYHLFKGDLPFADTLQPTPYPGLSICRADDDLAGIGVELALELQPHSMLLRRLASSPHTALDLIIIDCPPALGLLPVNALVASQLALIPVTPEPMARDGLHRAWRHIQRLRAKLNPRLELAGVVLTLAREDSIHTALAATLRAELGGRMLAVEVPFDPQVPAAAQYDLPVSVYDPFCPAARAYLALAEGLAANVRRIADARKGAAKPTRPMPAFDSAVARQTLRDWNHQASPGTPTPSAERTGKTGWLDDDTNPPEPSPPAQQRPALGLAAGVGVLAGAVVGAALAALAHTLGWLA